MSKLVPSLVVTSYIELVKLRSLPIAGKRLVELGDQVESDTVIAEVEMPGELYVVRLAEETGLDQEIIVKNFQVKDGDSLEQDQQIFSYKGFLGLIKATVASPVKGKVEFFTAENCHLGIRAEPKLFQLKAYLAGKITSIEANQHFKISSKASLLQAVFGVGGEQSGDLLELPLAAEEPLRDSCLGEIKDKLSGKIVFGGTDPNIQVLNSLADAGINGLIISS